MLQCWKKPLAHYLRYQTTTSHNHTAQSQLYITLHKFVTTNFSFSIHLLLYIFHYNHPLFILISWNRNLPSQPKIIHRNTISNRSTLNIPTVEKNEKRTTPQYTTLIKITHYPYATITREKNRNIQGHPDSEWTYQQSQLWSTSSRPKLG